MPRILDIKEGVKEYTRGNQARLELTRNYHVAQYPCKLKIRHTNTADAVIKDGNLLSLINSISINANGEELIKRVPATKFMISQIMTSGRTGLKSISTAEGEQESYIYFTINMTLPNAVRATDTIFNTAVYSTLDMLIDWGTDTNLGTGVTVNSAELEVTSRALVNYSRNSGELIKHFKETYLKKSVESTNNELSVEIAPNQRYKGFSIMATADGLRTNDIIKGITIKSGTTIIMQQSAHMIQWNNISDYNIKSDDTIKGLHIIDFTPRGKMSDLLDTITNFNTLTIVFDVEKVDGVNELHIFPEIVEITKAVEVQRKA